MLDTLLELFERDKKSSTKRSGGLRGRLANALDSERDHDHRYDDRSRERDRDDDDRYRSRERDDDDRYQASKRDDDDRDDDDRPSKRKKKREFDFLDFGD